VLVGELNLRATDPPARRLARTDEQDLPTTVVAAVAARALVLRQEPQARRDLRVGEQLPRQGHHALDHIVLDHAAADLALAALLRTHGAVGQHDAGAAAG